MFLTLIICLKAQDCVVMAADSLTTRGDTTTSCTTEKLHQVGPESVTAGCGLSQVMGMDWRTLLAKFPPLPTGSAFDDVLTRLHGFLDDAISRIPTNMVGANRGGNTFLLAGHHDPCSGTVVARLTRGNIDRQFQEPMIASDPSNLAYIDWIGDLTAIEAYISNRTSIYKPGMSEDDAVDFAVSAIKDGIRASVQAGNRTIGGEIISVAVVKSGHVTLFHKPSGFACDVDTLAAHYLASPDR